MARRGTFKSSLPLDTDDDVSGTVMGEGETEGKVPAVVAGRWTGLYRAHGQHWRLVNVFTRRSEAYRYFAQLADGANYRLAALSGSLRTVRFGI